MQGGTEGRTKDAIFGEPDVGDITFSGIGDPSWEPTMLVTWVTARPDWSSRQEVDQILSLPRSINLRLSTYALPIPVLVFYLLALTGCISNSPALPNIYTLKIQSKTGLFANATVSEIRLGYFAGLDCGLTTGVTAGQLVQKYAQLGNDPTTSIELEQLFSWALSLQRIIPPLLSVRCALFFIGVLFLAELKRRMWRSQHQRVQRSPSLSIMYTLAIIWGSTAFGLVSAVSVELTTAGVQSVTSILASSSISLTAGIAVVVLQWLAFSFSAIFALGLHSILRTEQRDK
ncbi:hypothetical protein BDZ45DRAFT_740212 [Acephala macrosclerotiorum]|nr:hypothetical protein BDZ45DRAFT_740212 [Acephala macrosclerotiorum]